MKILIVDDSKAMRMIVKRTVRKAGFDSAEYLEAENGVEALKTIKASKPDIVLSDWNMPEMGGMELLLELNKINSEVKFGFVTSEGSLDMRQKAEEAGALFLIAKPFNSDTLKDALQGIG